MIHSIILGLHLVFGETTSHSNGIVVLLDAQKLPE